MALADLNPRSTLKYLIKTDLTGLEGKILTLNATDTATFGVAVLELANSIQDVPVAVIVVGAASDSGTYPGTATNCEIYDTLAGCFDGALSGAAIVAGTVVAADSTGRFQTASGALASGDYVIGVALTPAANAGEQFTIKFLPFRGA